MRKSVFLSERLLSYLPSNNAEEPPVGESHDPIDRKNTPFLDIISTNPNRPYNVKKIIEDLVDQGSFFEVQKDFAKNLIIGFARMNGLTVGIVANQPYHLAGCLDIDSGDKASRFISSVMLSIYLW